MSSTQIRMASSPETYRRRRAALAAKLRRPLVIFGGHAPARNYPSNPYPFRAGSTYLYYGGPPIENAALLIEPGSDGDSAVALARPRPEPDDPLWFGETPDDAQFAQAAGLNVARIIDSDRLGSVIGNRKCGSIIAPYTNTYAWAADLDVDAADEDELRAIIDQRLIKDDEELGAMRLAAEANIAAHRAAFAATAVGRTESDAEAAFTAALVAHGCRNSFNPIVTVRGEVLHGASAGRKLQDGALLLIDAGAEEFCGYASDITRTIPVSGRWSDVQRHLYDTVLRAEMAAIEACRPGVRYRDVHAAAARVVCEGLVAAELLRGDPAHLADRGAYALFFPHGVGHLLGLDVHDMEDFGDTAGYPHGRRRPTRFGDRFLRLDRDLQPGMTVTIEPGIYLVPNLWASAELTAPFVDCVNRPAVDALLADNFGGIRIEDDVCIRDGAPEVLTAALPKTADDIAALVNE